MSTDLQSSVKGISSSGTTTDIIHLFQCLQANLSQTSIFLVHATYTFTFFLTQAGKLSHFLESKSTTSIQDALNGAFESYFSWHSRS